MTKTPYAETNLVGTLKGGISTIDTTIKVEFTDRVTGVAREPLATTKMFTIDKGTDLQPNSKYEIIQCTSHSTTNGVTALIGCTRGISSSGAIAAGTGKSHVSNAEIGCADVHHLYYGNSAKLNGDAEIDEDITVANGTKVNFGGTDAYVVTENSGDDLKFKDNNNSERTLSQLAISGSDEKVKITATDTTDGFLYDKVTDGSGIKKTIANPGANESIEMAVDTSDTSMFVETSSGASDSGKSPILDATGKEDFSIQPQEVEDALDGASGNVSAANLNTLTAGTGSVANSLHTHTGLTQMGSGSTGSFSTPLNVTSGQVLGSGTITIGFEPKRIQFHKGTSPNHETSVHNQTSTIFSTNFEPNSTAVYFVNMAVTAVTSTGFSWQATADRTVSSSGSYGSISITAEAIS